MSISGITDSGNHWANPAAASPLGDGKRKRGREEQNAGALSPDTVHFGNKARKRVKTETTRSPEPAIATEKTEGPTQTKPAAESAAPTGQRASKTSSPGGQRVYGHTENNLREAARIVLCDIAPLALSILPLVGLPGVGFLFALATLPLSYLAGKLGRRVAQNVNPDDLNPAFQYVHRIKSAISSKQSGPNGNVIDVINKATEDLLNVRGLPAFVAPHVLPLLKVKPNSGAAKLLTKLNGIALMRTEVNIRLAQAQNGKEASKAMFTGVKDFALFSAMNQMGTALVASPVPGAKLLGEFLKNAAWIKIAADLLSAKNSKPLTTNPEAR